MEKSSKASKCNPVCEKLLKAFAGHPNFRKFRPLSNRQQESKPANPSVPTHRNSKPNAETMVRQNVSIKERIEGKKELNPSYSLQIHAQENNVKTNMERKQKAVLEQAKKVAVGNGEENHFGGDQVEKDINDVFTDYINRAKHKLRSISSKGHDSGKKKKESVKDHQFSDYISRAKNKLRATSSSVGFGKGSSMKRE